MEQSDIRVGTDEHHVYLRQPLAGRIKGTISGPAFSGVAAEPNNLTHLSFICRVIFCIRRPDVLSRAYRSNKFGKLVLLNTRKL